MQGEDSDADSTDAVAVMSARDAQIAQNRFGEDEQREFDQEKYQDHRRTQRNILQKDDTDFSPIEFAPYSGNEANDQQKVDFDQQLQAYKERTEMTLPYVAT